MQCPATTPSVTNANGKYRGRTIGSRASYTCNQYYDLKGTAVISCQSDETWQTPKFTCQRKSFKLPVQTNMTLCTTLHCSSCPFFPRGIE
jgi:hypothetical protein